MLSELETCGRHKGAPESGEGSTQSWVEVPSVGEGRDGHGADGHGCGTARNGVKSGKEDRFTPNGTRIPDGSPPREDQQVPDHPNLPPVPPFPAVVDDAAMDMLGQYEAVKDGSKNCMGDRVWKPRSETPPELTPGEARAFWLEREVMSLRQSLAKITNGNPFHASEYWSKGYHPPTGPPMLSGFPEQPVDLGRPDPDVAERISRANPGDAHSHLLGGSGNRSLHDRARCSIERHSHLRGGNGERPPQGRARMSMGGDCSQIEPPGHLLGGCGPPALQARAPHGAHGICPDHRADRGVCHDDRVFASPLHPEVQQRS